MTTPMPVQLANVLQQFSNQSTITSTSWSDGLRPPPQSASEKAYTTLDKVSNIISVTFITISFMCTLFVIINLIYKKRKRRNPEKDPLTSSTSRQQRHSSSDQSEKRSSQQQYTDLTQYAILCMIFSDLFMEALYFPTNLIRLIDTFSSNQSNEVKRTSSFDMRTVSVVTAELTEMFVIASGIWSLFIATSIYQTVRSINEHHESIINTSRDSDEDSDDSTYDDTSRQKHSIVYTESQSGASSLKKRRKSKQESGLPSYRNITNSKIAYASVAWGVPFILCILCVVLEEKYLLGTRSTGKELYLINVLPDLIKSSLYFILEICTAVVRIRIFRCTQRMLSDISALLNTSPNAIRKRQEERRLFRQLSFYSLPFVLFGIWVIIYRSYEDILFTVRVARYGFDKFSDALNGPGKILMAIHHMFSPLRGLMNAIVYVFRKQIRKMDNSICC